MSTMPKSFVKLRISCKLVSATTMTKPWKDAKETSQKSHSSDVGEDALLLTVQAANKSADNKKEAAPYEEDTPWEPELE